MSKSQGREIMSGSDGTIPNGMRPMTGQGIGNCVIPISARYEKFEYLKKLSEAMEKSSNKLKFKLVKWKNLRKLSTRG
jgi:hypothetical protein